MVETIEMQLENGFNQLFCISSADEDSLFNTDIDPAKRILGHQQYESYIIDEVVPFVREENPLNFVIVCGVDMGGYHAVNIGLKYPEQFGKVMGISGVYDITPFLGDYYDENVYYNNPVDYMPNLNRDSLLDKIRKIDFRLVSYKNDTRKNDAYRLVDIFRSKMIDHKLDIWNLESEGEWDLWTEMLKVHII